MNYDQAYALARAIRESDEFRQFAAQQKKVEADPAAKRMLDDFRRRQLDLNMRQLRGETVGPDELDRLKKLYETINLHAEIRKLLQAEQRLHLMMEDIQRIIAEPFEQLLGSQAEQFTKGG